MQAHIIRRVKCNEVRDDNWVTEKSLENYDKLLETIIGMIDDVKVETDIDDLIALNDNLVRKLKRLEQFSKMIPDFNANDLDDLKALIKQELKKRKGEIINF